ncbi:MAG: DUF481 domain-containing protein, partial [Candidatus Acidiferrum sp.]
MRCRFLSPVVLLFLVVTGAYADQVTLKNGDRLSGAIVTGDGKTLLIKTEFAGDVTIQWDAITAIDSSGNLNLTLKDGKRLSGKIVTTDGKFVVAGAPPEAAGTTKDTIVAVRNDAEQKSYDIEAEKTAHPKFTYFWGGLFDTGLALTRGNSATVSYTLSAKAVRETPKDKLTLYSTYIYANDDTLPPSRTTANALRAGARFDYNLSPRTFVFGLADFETNELQHLSLRNVFGGGFGYHVIKTDNTVFDVFGGITYDRDSFSSYIDPGPPPVPIAASIQN